MNPHGGYNDGGKVPLILIFLVIALISWFLGQAVGAYREDRRLAASDPEAYRALARESAR